MVRRGVQVRDGDVSGTSRRSAGDWLVGAALMALLALAGCAAQGQANPAPPAPTHSTVAAATPTPTVPMTPTATPVAITNLSAFRQQLSNAVTSGHWSMVQAMLSPSFSFQTETAGSDLLMPDAATHLNSALKDGSPWGEGDSYALSIHICYAGDTPQAQIIGFVGNNNHYIMFAIQQPTGQSYWSVAWGFEDPQGPYDSCIFGNG